MTFWSFAQIYVFCESSEFTGSQFDRINIFHECDWYLFQVGAQKNLVPIIHFTQQSVVFKGFGNIPFTRESFKTVIEFKIRTELTSNIWFLFVPRWSMGAFRISQFLVEYRNECMCFWLKMRLTHGQ